MTAVPSSQWKAIAIFTVYVALAWSGLATPRASFAGCPPVGGGVTVPLLFVPGYAASAPTRGNVLAYALHRGVSPLALALSVSYKPFVRSLHNAGYRDGQTFFGAVYDWRMPAAPEDGTRDGTLAQVTADLITSGTFQYAINYLGYWLDRVVQANPGVACVDVASHSTGNVLVRAYIQSPAYGASYVDGNGITRQLPKIRYYIAGAGINEGTIHSWRPWQADFQDVLSGFIPTTKIEGRFAALAFASVIAGGQIPGPDYTITLPMILQEDKNGRRRPDPVIFFRLYNPMRQRLMPTVPFLTLPDSNVLIDVNDAPSLSPEVMLDLNAGSSMGHNPWAALVGFPNGQNGGVIATFATGAREKTTVRDFTTAGLVNQNPFICTASYINQLAPRVPPMCTGGQDINCFLPLLALLTPQPHITSVTQSLFPRVGDLETKQQLNGDGNGFMSSYLSTYTGDPNVQVVTWGNGVAPASPPVPPIGCQAASNVPSWDNETDYPVYHDVFYYNPNVRGYIISTLTGLTPPAEAVITLHELVELLRFLDGDILIF